MPPKQDWSVISHEELKKEHNLQFNFEKWELFPVVLNDFKDQALNKDCIAKPQSEAVAQQAPLATSEFVVPESDFVSLCKNQAQQNCPSFQGKREDKDDDAAPLLVNRLRREITPGSSVLTWLSEGNDCQCATTETCFINSTLAI